MTISETVLFLIWDKDTKWDTRILLCWHDSLFRVMLNLLCCKSGESSTNSFILVREMDTSIVTAFGGVQLITLEGSA